MLKHLLAAALIAAGVTGGAWASGIALREGYQAASPDRLKAGTLKGTPVYAAGDEMVGDVSALIADASGRTAQVVIGVGGFLGIGERDMALPADQVSFQNRADGSDLRAYVGTPADRITALPEYTAPR